MQDIARTVQVMIKEACGEDIAFTLLVFTEPQANYVSSAPRDVSIAQLRRVLNIQESGEQEVPAHERN